MAKDPAFLFYPKDWLQGTAKLMPNEKGVYIDLLAHQHQDGDLPNDTKRLARIVGISENEFLPIWEELKQHFILVNNRLVNRKLTEIITERLEKGKQNKIIGTMAAIFRLSDKPYEIKYKAKETFDFKHFLAVETTELTECITEWFRLRLKSIEDGNGNEDVNTFINTLHNKVKPIIENFSEKNKNEQNGNTNDATDIYQSPKLKEAFERIRSGKSKVK